MHKNRLDALSDGIFAIVMTLLVIEIKVPEIHYEISNLELFHQLIDIMPLFVSYLLSFVVLFTYWRTHTFIFNLLAKNLDMTLVNLNAFFLLSIGLIPFSSHLLGQHGYTQTAIIFYAMNIIISGLLLYSMRFYIRVSKSIENEPMSDKMRRNSRIRALLPPICACISIVFSFVNPIISIFLFTFPVVFNLIPGGLDLIDRTVEKFTGKNMNLSDS